MQDRVCIITGGNSGIGYATCEGLAAAGATVIMASRDAARARRAIDKIRKSTGIEVDFLPLDLASHCSIREFAQTFRSRFDRLHVLIHNAGIERYYPVPVRITSQAYTAIDSAFYVACAGFHSIKRPAIGR